MDEEKPKISILEYAYSTIKQVGFQSLIDYLKSIIQDQINTENNNKLNFQIFTPEDDQQIEGGTLSLTSDDIRDRMEELQEYLRRKGKGQDEENQEDWQMTIDIPKELTLEQIESAVNTEAVFSYLIAQNWINNYTDQAAQFLYGREKLKAELNQSEEKSQFHMIFYNEPKPEEPPEEAEGEKEAVDPDAGQDDPLEKSNFMKAKNKTLRKTVNDLKVPSKYDHMRRPPQEVPHDIIKKLFLTIDQDLDDRISVQEIKRYMKKVKLSLEDDIADALFKEITDRRSVVHERQRNLPLTLEEVVAAIKGRHKWNQEEKFWEVSYRPMREYWVILLKTVSEKVFTLPAPEIKPEKILAQYELNEMMMEERKKKKLEGTVKKYTSIRDVKLPTYKRKIDKPEVEIEPDKNGKVVLGVKKGEEQKLDPLEFQINHKIKKEKDDEGNEFPKMSWEARAFFEQSLDISKKGMNHQVLLTGQVPENVYIPQSAFAAPEIYPPQGSGHKTNDSFSVPEADKSRMRNKNMNPGHRSKKSEKSMPSTPYEVEEQSIRTFSRNPTKSMEQTTSGLNNQNQNMIYGPKGGLRTFTKSQMALTQFKKGELSKATQRTEIAGLQNPEPIYKRYGFRTRFILNDLFTDKAKFARDARNFTIPRNKDNTKELKDEFIPDEFKPFKDPVFRDDDLPFGKQPLDLLSSYKCPRAVNPDNMSEMNVKPIMVQDKELKQLEATLHQRQEEYEKAIQGDQPRLKELTWTKYHHVPQMLKPMCTGLKDEYRPKRVKKIEDPFLAKEEYGLDMIPRPVKQEFVIGRDNMQLYFKPLKARDDDIDEEFGRVHKKYKTIY